MKRQWVWMLIVTGLLAGMARGEVVRYYASGGLLPSSSEIPAGRRFDLIGEASHAAMGPGELHITDASEVDEIQFVRTPTLLRDQDAVFELTVQVHWADRDDINAAGAVAFHDDLRFMPLLLCPDRVGFAADLPGTLWLASTAMDTTDAYHEYRIIKSGQDTVSLFVDDNPAPLLSAPYADFPLKTSPYNALYPHGAAIAWQGSNQGRGEVSITYVAYNSDGTVIPDLVADFDTDGDVDADDIDEFCRGFWPDPDPFSDPRDFNGDGVVDEDDLVIMIETYVQWDSDGDGDPDGTGTSRGDFDLDGLVNATDLAIMNGAFGTWPRGWADGNANCDDVINSTDLAILAANFGVAPTAPAAVPEPATMGVLALGGAGLLRRRRRA